MSDVRIERVEPCEHGNTGTHTMCRHPESFHRHDNCPDPILCPRGSRKVLDGFPPEAVEAAAKSIDKEVKKWPEPPPSGLIEPGWWGATTTELAEAALAAAWDALVGEVSE